MQDAASDERWLAPILKSASGALLVGCLLPFAYLTTVSLLLSAYVRGCGFPSRPFLKTYAGPSNGHVVLPGAGGVFSNYSRYCDEVTGANYDPRTNQCAPERTEWK